MARVILQTRDAWLGGEPLLAIDEPVADDEGQRLEGRADLGSHRAPFLEGEVGIEPEPARGDGYFFVDLGKHENSWLARNRSWAARYDLRAVNERMARDGGRLRRSVQFDAELGMRVESHL